MSKYSTDYIFDSLLTNLPLMIIAASGSPPHFLNQAYTNSSVTIAWTVPMFNSNKNRQVICDADVAFSGIRTNIPELIIYHTSQWGSHVVRCSFFRSTICYVSGDHLLFLISFSFARSRVQPTTGVGHNLQFPPTNRIKSVLNRIRSFFKVHCIGRS